jgi:hypothetical protein
MRRREEALEHVAEPTRRVATFRSTNSPTVRSSLPAA